MNNATSNLQAWLKALIEKRCLVVVCACEIKFHTKKISRLKLMTKKTVRICGFRSNDDRI